LPNWIDREFIVDDTERPPSAGQLAEPQIKPHPRRLSPNVNLGERVLKPTRPPNFRTTKSKTRNCHHCEYVDKVKGVCTKYNGWPVKRDDVCDAFEEEDS